MHFAAAAQSPDVIALLIKVEADADTPDPQGWTPLHVAAAKGCAACLAHLLASANVERTTVLPHISSRLRTLSGTPYRGLRNCYVKA
jgi:ankyrin repeat protein